MKTPQEINRLLSGFFGTEAYHKLSIIPGLIGTDGVKALCVECRAFWLFDAIASHQRNRKMLAACDGMQFWKLKAADGAGATLTCDDGNGNIQITQRIEFTDFPFGAFDNGVAQVYVGDHDGVNRVAMLPGEY